MQKLTERQKWENIFLEDCVEYENKIMNDKQLSEKYGLGRKYKEIEITQENLYDFLKSVDLDHFSFDVFHKEPRSFLICGLVYKNCNDVETFKKYLMKYNKADIWKVFKFYSKICECDVFRVILEEKVNESK